MAVREDEDVAQAMGINLVTTKLMAFAHRRRFFGPERCDLCDQNRVGLSPQLQCHRFHQHRLPDHRRRHGQHPRCHRRVPLPWSDLPELLREFAEYRLLVYGAALVAMMLLKPEGLWPDVKRRRELHIEEDENETRRRKPATAGS